MANAGDRLLIERSGLFDTEFYLTNRPDVKDKGIDPIEHYLNLGWKENSDPSANFSTGHYLSLYSDVRDSGQNPLLHYIKAGKQEGRQCSAKRDFAAHPNAPRPHAPSREEWNALRQRFRGRDLEPVVDVLVPVYGGYDETMRCIFSVITSSQTTAYRLLVVNDASPDGPLVDELNELSDAGLFDLINLEENLGFVGACNIGMSDTSTRDVVLLNSDTEVHNDWLDRLRKAAYADDRIATVTPLSNNAEICSYPKFCQDNWTALELCDRELDELAAKANADQSLVIPTGVGFCMYVRRECLNQIGLFDHANFGKGYGEENDLCRRAASSGWTNVLAPNVFVRHYGGASFGASKLARIAKATQTIERLHPGYGQLIHDFVRRDPAQTFRQALDVARLKHQSRNGAILSVLHSWGGGTEVHVADMSRRIRACGMGALTCKVDSDDSGVLRITDTSCAELPNIPTFRVATDLNQFASWLYKLDVRHVHIHHLAGFPDETADFLRLASSQANLTYDVTLHDYISICPRITLTDRSGVYCGEPEISECERCIQRDGSAFGKPSVWAWRDRYSRLLAHARKVFVPNDDVSIRLKRYFNEIEFSVRPHPEVAAESHLAEAVKTGQHKDGTRVIALIGAIGPHKGSELLLKVAEASKRLKLPLAFHVVGYTDRDAQLGAIGNVTITGRYAEQDAARLLLQARADFVFFASVLPETFSYTLSTAFATRQFPVSFDLGAIARRIKEAHFGQLLPIELMTKPRELAFELARLVIPRDATPPQEQVANYPNILTDYYGWEV